MSNHSAAKAQQPLKLDLNKAAGALKLSLEKAGVAGNLQVETAGVFDVSGSFEHEHEEGTTSVLLERLVPYCMVMDPDEKMDIFSFSSGERSAYYVGAVTPADAEGYVSRNIVGKVPGWNGGTTYSYVLERVLENFGWKECEEDHAPKQGKGWLSRLFGGGDDHSHASAHHHEKKKSLVLFVTDGENDKNDEARTMQVLEASQKRGDQVYFLMIGACEHVDVKFEFLQKIADKFKNTGVVIIRDLEGFVEKSDDELNKELLNPELIEWLKS